MACKMILHLQSILLSNRGALDNFNLYRERVQSCAVSLGASVQSYNSEGALLRLQQVTSKYYYLMLHVTSTSSVTLHIHIFCYTSVSLHLVLHLCYSCVTLMLHLCYTCVTLVLHLCYICVTLMLHLCYTCVNSFNYSDCPAKQREVCADDGKTYYNQCHLDAENCMTRGYIRKVSDGFCNAYGNYSMKLSIVL